MLSAGSVVQCSPLVQVEGDILQQIRAETEKDVVTSRLLKQVREGVTRRFWVEDSVLYAKGQRPYVPNSCGLRRSKLLSENHETPWAGHPGQQRTLALLSRSFDWPGFFGTVCKNLSCLSAGQG